MNDQDTESKLAAYFAARGRLLFNEHDVPKWLRKQLVVGFGVELEHGRRQDGKLDVTHDDVDKTIKIALAHLREFPDYYDRLTKMEQEAEEYWSSNPDKTKHKVVESIVAILNK